MIKLKHFLLSFFALLLFSCNAPSQKPMPEKAVLNKKEQQTPITPTSPFQDLSIEQFKEKMVDKEVIVLDVRTPEETALGKIEKAVEINVLDASFAEKIEELNKDKTYLVYCKSGGRSVKACNAMSNAGFKNLYNLPDGYTKWSQEGNGQ